MPFVALAHPPGDPGSRISFELRKEPLGDGVLEVVAPPSQASIDGLDDMPGRSQRDALVGEPAHLSPDCLLGRRGGMGVRVSLLRSSLLPPLDAEAEEVDALVQMSDLGLPLGEPKSERSQHIPGPLKKRFRVLAGSGNQSDPVVGVPYQPPVSFAALLAPGAFVLAAHRFLPVLGEEVVQLGEGDADEQGG